MLGIFDSGVGGLTALKEIKRLSPKLDVCFLADRANAPYGTKTEEEIITYTKRNIKALMKLGARRVLIACCTASSIHHLLSESERAVSVPIIDFAARRAAEISENGRIGVIATERTVLSGAFYKSIKSYAPKAFVFEVPAQSFVSIVESGGRDNNLTENQRRTVEKTLSAFNDKKIDTLILGCTHFPHIKAEIERILGVKTVNPSEVAAKKILSEGGFSENGRCIYL